MVPGAAQGHQYLPWCAQRSGTWYSQLWEPWEMPSIWQQRSILNFGRNRVWIWEKVKYSNRPLRWLRNWNIWHTRRGWKSWDCLALRRNGILPVYINTWWEGVKQIGTDPLVVSSERKGSGHKLKYRKFHIDIWKNFSYSEDGQTLGKVAHRGGGLSTLGDTQNTTGQGSKQPAGVDPALSRGLDWIISRGPF